MKDFFLKFWYSREGKQNNALSSHSRATGVAGTPSFKPDIYCFKTTGGPLTLLPLRSTVTSTRSAILMNGMPLFMP